MISSDIQRKNKLNSILLLTLHPNRYQSIAFFASRILLQYRFRILASNIPLSDPFRRQCHYLCCDDKFNCFIFGIMKFTNLILTFHFSYSFEDLLHLPFEMLLQFQRIGKNLESKFSIIIKKFVVSFSLFKPLRLTKFILGRSVRTMGIQIYEIFTRMCNWIKFDW